MILAHFHNSSTMEMDDLIDLLSRRAHGIHVGEFVFVSEGNSK